MGGLSLSYKHSTSRVTPCYTSYIHRNAYRDLGSITVPKNSKIIHYWNFGDTIPVPAVAMVFFVLKTLI
jgi:hypothetical protein